MSLRDLLEKHRLETNADSHDDADQTAFGMSPSDAAKPASLTINIASKGEQWVLPWMGFNGACFSANADFPDGGKAERLDIFFARHDVIVFGQNLLGLRKSISAMSLAEIRETPAEYCAAAENHAQPYVKCIVVKQRAR